MKTEGAREIVCGIVELMNTGTVPARVAMSPLILVAQKFPNYP